MPSSSRTERRWPVPFDGEPPSIKPGEPVEIRTAFGQWLPATAASEPHYDFEQGLGRHTFLTVAVTNHGIAQTFGHPVNWPAEDVRPAGSPQPASECERCPAYPDGQHRNTRSLVPASYSRCECGATSEYNPDRFA